MKLQKGDIISHKKSFNKFYIITNDLLNGQYEVEDIDINIKGMKEKHIFIGKYLLTKSDRRNFVINDILDEDQTL